MSGAVVRELLKRSLQQVRRATGLPVVFGGPADERGVVLSVSAGMRSGSLDGLFVARDQGLGGRAIGTGRPVSVPDYRLSAVISHAYDHQVGTEGLVSLVAVPVIGEGAPGGVRAVLYGAMRQRGPVGDTAVDALTAAARRLATVLPPAGPSSDPAPVAGSGPGALGAVLREVGSLADRIPDAATRELLQQMCAEHRPGAGPADGPALSPRELDVLALVAAGCGNDMIADLLGGSADSIKAHLRSAMRRLRVSTRLAAVSRARSSGLIG
ncbi:LuxR C-terminal-related transcriptional regulator [Pseudonocardia sp. NPDC049635]|uniref:LuxR C-terminal-related transcriptional regulator n=1 Tax=Pseudonocardia sp. NPDC049635 TaxID=3155506 RepID=UPI0033DF9305